MRVIVGKDVEIIDAPVEVEQFVKEKYVLPNPEYSKKLQMGKWVGNTPKDIYLYAKNGNSLILPFGAFTNEFYQDAVKKYGASFESDFSPIRAISYRSNINLYPYQQNAVEKALVKRNGVIVMPCGAGKTQTALELISRLGCKTLWLTHTQDLLNQSMNRAKSVLGVSSDTYGTITAGKVNIGSGITFATVQTMCKIDLKQLKYAFDAVVVDECHKAIGSPTKVMQFYTVLSNLSCRYKFGLTATPKRADGLERSMFALLGNVIHEVSKEEVEHTTCPVRVKLLDTNYIPDMDAVLAGDGTINYSQLVDNLIHDEDRFRIVSDEINKHNQMLVLTNRVEYAERLCKAYNGKALCLSTMGNSKAAKMARKEALRQLDCGELDAVFATYQLAKEGLDVPNLRYVVFATPEKEETTVVQSAGRVGRKADGKEFGTVIDFVDSFAMYKGWAKKRQSYYKKLKYNIDID